MKLLTPHLHSILVEEGYTCCLSKSVISETGGRCIIILKPLKERPASGILPAGYDTCLSMGSEPLEMAYGISKTEVYLDFEPDK